MRNTFFKQERETNHVAVVFPGYGYRCYQPVIYYPSLALLSLGADVLWVEYAYDQESDYQSMQPSERREWRLSDSKAAINTALERQSYERLTLVGKSIGTSVIGDLLAEDPRLHAARVIWLTPLLKSEKLRTQLEQVNNPSLFVSGSVDSEYDAEFAARLEKRPSIRFLLLDDADHSLEVHADALRSVQMLRQLTEQVLEFLKE